MKNLNLFVILLACVSVLFTSCQSDVNTSTDITESFATTAAVNKDAKVTPTLPEPTIPVGPLTTMDFGETIFDFGEVMEGEKVIHNYTFTNTGNEPLIISNAKGSCGCTVPSWPREPIAPGESGEIKVQFDSKGKGKVGGNNQSKRVTLTANTDPAQIFLTIKGKVLKENASNS